MGNSYKLLIFFLLLISALALFGFGLSNSKKENGNGLVQLENEFQKTSEPEKLAEEGQISNKNIEQIAELHPMAIQLLRKREYPGGDFVTEEELPDGANYTQSIVSYRSEGLKIFGLLTVPKTQSPENGFPAVVFIHGYIPPSRYSTTGDYPTYQATLAKSGVVTFKPDLRGHGNSEGEPVSAHYSEKYVVDTLNAISFMKDHEMIDENRIGYWGHSNGGEIGLRVIVISPDIKAAVFWAGVVGSYQDMFQTYIDKIPFLSNENNPLVRNYGLPNENPQFWNELDPFQHLHKISAPVQLHHGTDDYSVPIELSQSLRDALKDSGKEVQYFEYARDDHNISGNTSLAWSRSIDFYRENL